MTLIDFYVLDKNSTRDQHHFACRLIEKAVRQGNRVMVATKDEAETQALDEALWSFRPESFVPHVTLSQTEENSKYAELSPVLISHTADDPSHHDVLVNLRLDVPEQFSRFQRLAEIVIQEEAALQNSRRNFAFFKERGYPVNTHKLRV